MADIDDLKKEHEELMRKANEIKCSIRQTEEKKKKEEKNQKYFDKNFKLLEVHEDSNMHLSELYYNIRRNFIENASDYDYNLYLSEARERYLKEVKEYKEDIAKLVDEILEHAKQVKD